MIENQSLFRLPIPTERTCSSKVRATLETLHPTQEGLDRIALREASNLTLWWPEDRRRFARIAERCLCCKIKSGIYIHRFCTLESRNSIETCNHWNQNEHAIMSLSWLRLSLPKISRSSDVTRLSLISTSSTKFPLPHTSSQHIHISRINNQSILLDPAVD